MAHKSKANKAYRAAQARINITKPAVVKYAEMEKANKGNIEQRQIKTLRQLDYLSKKLFKLPPEKLTPAQIEQLTSAYTKIKANKGSNADRKAGRTAGRYAKGLTH